MSKRKPKEKIRVRFRKNRETKTRQTDLTRSIQQETFQEESLAPSERVSGKGATSRLRTIVVEDGVDISVDEQCRRGLVLRVHGLNTLVEDDASGTLFRCATRRLLRTLATDQRHVIVAGDRVQFRPVGDFILQKTENQTHIGLETLPEGVIERVEPRYGCLSRTSYQHQHTMVANVDQMVIVTSLAEPTMKRNLIDRMLLAAEKNEIRPIVCVNKWDLGTHEDRVALVPVLGIYARMGYDIFPVSTRTGQGISRLRSLFQQAGRQSVVVGQSGVGKSSLLNAIEPGLNLRIGTVSDQTEKGRHTTVSAQLIRLSGGGHVVDTPGIRQFGLWDVIPAEVAGFFRDIRPLESFCQFDDCTHSHETNCAVRDAVELGMLDARRYESYLQIIQDS